MKRTIIQKLAICFLMTSLFTLPVSAGQQDWSAHVHVTYIELKVGDSFRFQVDTTTGSCSANGWLIFDARFYDASLRSQIVKDAYAVVLATKLSGQTLDIFGDNTPVQGGCVVGIVNAH